MLRDWGVDPTVAAATRKKLFEKGMVRGGRVTAAVDRDLGREKRAGMHVVGSRLVLYYRHINH